MIAPIADELDSASVDTILYAADGALRYIPLTALHDGDQWLIHRYTINHITAASLIDFLDTDPTPIRLLAGAFPAQSVQVILGDRLVWFGGLPYAQTEVQTLASEIPDTTVWFSQDFNHTVLDTLNQYTVIHFATHAEFHSGSPVDSFILLGDGDRITLQDLSQWELPNFDLVVLSACKTAVSSNLGTGEEVLGFGYQIQQTGAEPATPSLPLGHPYFWAPFILIGNGL